MVDGVYLYMRNRRWSRCFKSGRSGLSGGAQVDGSLAPPEEGVEKECSCKRLRNMRRGRNWVQAFPNPFSSMDF
ncbi:hypothetical protein M8C21_001728 [Ambrosia artemisiifolia]|uniref:Uncharacterized protein n=1 Tax=Ambrosia artemisiifolia TaxID=4212 RepID=A0AAD5CNX7_AMBAR|nr:hypothetical protein M8C21_001728 [Ambrosia artemisiifolia]